MMATRDEIREGIAQIEGSYIIADALLTYLDAQGVVIKKERQLPKGWDFIPSWDNAIKEMLDAGYVATEPLIDNGN